MPPLDERIDEAATAKLNERVPGWDDAELAAEHQTTVSSVQRLLRRYGVRLWSVGGKADELRRGPA